MHKINQCAVTMGSGASNNVKNIQIDQQSDKYDRPTSSSKDKKGKNGRSTEKELEDLRAVLAATRESLAEATQKSSSAEHGAKELEKQMCELESTNVDLNEQIQSLEEKLEYMNSQNLVTQDNTPVESLKLKDKVIDKLQSRTKEVEDEINLLKRKYKKKVQRINSQLAESKQDSTLKLFELKDQLAKQTEEKARLEERLSRTNSASSRRGDHDDIEDGDSGVGWEDNRMKVILDLSRRVSDQSEKISSLEQELKCKDLIIEQLKELLKENGISSEVIDAKLMNSGSVETSTWKRSSSASKQNRTASSNNNEVSLNVGQTKNDSQAVADTNDGSDLKSIAREMRRLKKSKHKEKTKVNEDLRESSSTSRDSGVLDISNKPPSAGKSRRIRSGDASQRISSAASSLSTVSEQDTETSSRSAHLTRDHEPFDDLEELVGKSVSQSSLRQYVQHNSTHSMNSSERESARKKRTKKHSYNQSAGEPGVCVDPVVKATNPYSIPST